MDAEGNLERLKQAEWLERQSQLFAMGGPCDAPNLGRLRSLEGTTSQPEPMSGSPEGRPGGGTVVPGSGFSVEEATPFRVFRLRSAPVHDSRGWNPCWLTGVSAGSGRGVPEEFRGHGGVPGQGEVKCQARNLGYMRDPGSFSVSLLCLSLQESSAESIPAGSRLSCVDRPDVRQPQGGPRRQSLPLWRCCRRIGRCGSKLTDHSSDPEP